MDIHTKRVYEAVEPADGWRILVDRLWPRGLSKKDARIDHWARTLAPSDALRKWYQHDPDKWSEFRRRYFAELDTQPGKVAELAGQIGSATVTFVFSTREETLNNASALRDYFLKRNSSHSAKARPRPSGI